VLSWGAQARVLHPPDLIQAVKEQAAALLAAYDPQALGSGNNLLDGDG
jgi:predicted DNA-binding transcriptional regulator YafY